MNILITGASRGLGLEMVRQYAAAGHRVMATCRDPAAATALARLAATPGWQVTVESLDVVDHAAVDALAARCRGTAIDLLINNAGTMGPRDPDHTQIYRQKVGTIDYAAWRDVLEVNTLAPLKVAEAFVEHVAASRGRQMIFISSTTGSNVEGRHATFSYCSSKGALNKVVTMLAMALEPRGIVCAAVCPGWVRTELGGPGAGLEVEESITGLRQVIAGLDMARTGSFTRYNGETIAW